MRNISVISSLIYVVLTAIYFIFGKSDSSVWSALFYVNTGLYISFLLIDKVMSVKNITTISLLVSAITFQMLLVALEVYLVVWCREEYFKEVNSWFWSLVFFVVALIFVITYKIINTWENG